MNCTQEICKNLGRINCNDESGCYYSHQKVSFTCNYVYVNIFTNFSAMVILIAEMEVMRKTALKKFVEIWAKLIVMTRVDVIIVMRR